MKNQALITVLVAIIAIGVGFAGGMYYSRTRVKNFIGNAGQNGRAGQVFFQGGNNTGRGSALGNRGFRPINGEITSIDDKSITVSLSDGSSKIIVVSDSTNINKAETANKSDLKTGDTVAVFGTDNADGSVTANTIQLNPVMLQQSSPEPSPSAK